MRELDKTERFILGTSLLCLVAAIGLTFWTHVKEKKLREQNTCECKCFDAGYESALMDIQVLSEPTVRRSREDY